MNQLNSQQSQNNIRINSKNDELEQQANSYNFKEIKLGGYKNGQTNDYQQKDQRTLQMQSDAYQQLLYLQQQNHSNQNNLQNQYGQNTVNQLGRSNRIQNTGVGLMVSGTQSHIGSQYIARTQSQEQLKSFIKTVNNNDMQNNGTQLENQLNKNRKAVAQYIVNSAHEKISPFQNAQIINQNGTLSIYKTASNQNNQIIPNQINTINQIDSNYKNQILPKQIQTVNGNSGAIQNFIFDDLQKRSKLSTQKREGQYKISNIEMIQLQKQQKQIFEQNQKQEEINTLLNERKSVGEYRILKKEQEIIQKPQQQEKIIIYQTPQQQKNPFIPYSPGKLHLQQSLGQKQIKIQSQESKQQTLSNQKLFQIVSGTSQYSKNHNQIQKTSNPIVDDGSYANANSLIHPIHQYHFNQSQLQNEINLPQTIEGQNGMRHLRVISKNKVKQIHYGHQPLLHFGANKLQLKNAQQIQHLYTAFGPQVQPAQIQRLNFSADNNSYPQQNQPYDNSYQNFIDYSNQNNLLNSLKNENHDKLFQAFKQVINNGGQDVSGIDMLRNWQIMYGQQYGLTNKFNGNTSQGYLQLNNQQLGNLSLPRFRQKQKFEQSMQNLSNKINSIDATLQPQLAYFQNPIDLMTQNLKISQLNQISSVLDQQTEKLIAYTQKLLNQEAHMLDYNDENFSANLANLGLQGDQAKGKNTRLSYSGVHHKQYDRQRMMDFYSSIRMGDIDDQAKLRSQAIKMAPPLDPNKLRFSVLPGNNSRLIRIAMERRRDFWIETTIQDPHYHFKWSPVSAGIKFDLVGKDINPDVHPCVKQYVNHFEGHTCISEKSKLLINLSNYSQNKLNENVFDFLPLTFFVECDPLKQKQFSKNMVQFMNAFYALDDIKKRTKKFYQKLDQINQNQNYQPIDLQHQADDGDNEDTINNNVHIQSDNKKENLLFDDNFIFKHFYQNKMLLIKQHKKEEREEKEALQAVINIKEPQIHNKQDKQRIYIENNTAEGQDNQQVNNNASPITIETQKLQNQLQQQNNQNIKNAQNKLLKKYFFRQSMPFCHYSGHNLWILKATKLNQGQGIHVCNSLPQVKSLIQRYCEGIPKKQTDNFMYEKDLKKQSQQNPLQGEKQTEKDMVESKNNGANIGAGYQSSDSKRVSNLEQKNKFGSKSIGSKIYSASIGLSNDDKNVRSSTKKNESDQKLNLTNKKESIDYDNQTDNQKSQKKIGISPQQKKDKISPIKFENSPQIGKQSQIKVQNRKFNLINESKVIDENDMERDNSNQRDRDHQLIDDEKLSQKNQNENFSPLRRKNSKKNASSPKRQFLNHTKIISKADKMNQLASPKVDENSKFAIDTQQQKPARDCDPKYKHNSFIIQKYIERPFLVNQRKFDIRVWVFLDSKGNAYFCKEGYLRLSSYKFELDPDDPDNKFVHLTNIAVQKYSNHFGAHEDGNILSFQKFEEYVNQSYPQKNYNTQNDLIKKIKQQIARTLIATRKIMDPHKRAQQYYNQSNFFELFGYDFMIDEDFNLWLIECNTNPSIAESSKYLEQLIPRMIEDMIKLTVDQEFNYFYHQVIQVNKQLISQATNPSEIPTDLADEAALHKVLNIPSPKLESLGENENIWEKMMNLKDRHQRKEGKQQYCVPILINSKYAFNIKNRDFKIKKYISNRVNSHSLNPIRQPSQVKQQNLANDQSAIQLQAIGEELPEGQETQILLNTNNNQA